MFSPKKNFDIHQKMIDPTKFIWVFIGNAPNEDERVFRVITVILCCIGIVLSCFLSFVSLAAVGILICVLSTGWFILAITMQQEFHNFNGFTKLWGFLAGCYTVGMLPFGLPTAVVTGIIFGFIWACIFFFRSIQEIFEKKRQ